MKIFPVGGYVRDMLLRKRGFKLPEGDRDWVVIGEIPEATKNMHWRVLNARPLRAITALSSMRRRM